jgi:hypothetical protein
MMVRRKQPEKPVERRFQLRNQIHGRTILEESAPLQVYIGGDFPRDGGIRQSGRRIDQLNRFGILFSHSHHVSAAKILLPAMIIPELDIIRAWFAGAMAKSGK